MNHVCKGKKKTHNDPSVLSHNPLEEEETHTHTSKDNTNTKPYIHTHTQLEA